MASKTVQSIQILRFLAAFGVVLFHAHGNTWRLGASGVHIFFVISGFVMVLTCYSRPQPMRPSTFLQRRFLRIYPIYWLIAGAYMVVRGTVLSPAQLSGAIALYSHDASLIIGQGWTLAYEIYFYLVFAICLAVKRGLTLLSVFFLGSVAARPLAGTFPIATDPLLLEFLVGCWLGYIYLLRSKVLHFLGWPCLALGVALLLLSGFVPAKAIPSVVTFGVPAAMIVGGAVSLEQWFQGAAATLFAKLGDSSYFLYLAHFLVIELLGGSSSNPVVSITLAVVCVIVSHAGHLCIERPLMQVLSGAWAQKRNAAAV